MVLLLKNYFSVLNECYVPIHDITLSHFSLSGPSPIFISARFLYFSLYYSVTQIYKHHNYVRRIH
uniref:Putative ovule protein n=1 Tax=Solanum chacoense TaxID=4108 RepID=A0A0V0H1K5_SOLCH